LVLFLVSGLFLSACDDDNGTNGPGDTDLESATTLLTAYYSGIAEATVLDTVDNKFVIKNASGSVVITYSGVPSGTYPENFTVTYQFINYGSNGITINGTLTGNYTFTSENDFNYTLNGTLSDNQGGSLEYKNFGLAVANSGSTVTYSGAFVINGITYNVDSSTGFFTIS
jgi:hypothetical protein